MKYIRHVHLENGSLELLGSDPQGNILIQKLDLQFSQFKNRLIVDEREMSMLMDTIQRYQKSSKDTDKKSIGRTIVMMLKWMAQTAPHKVEYLMIICFYMNDIDSFRYFVDNALSIGSLIKGTSFLQICMVNNRQTRHLELVKEYIDDHMHSLRYDQQFAVSVAGFLKALQRDPRVDQFLSRKLARSIIKSLLLADTGQTVAMEVDDADAPVISFGTIAPPTGSVEERLVDKKMFMLESRPQKSAEDYRVFRSMIDIDMTPGSSESILFFNFISRFPDEDIKTVFKPLFYFKFYFMFWPLLLFAVIDWVCAVLLYLYYGFHFDKDWRSGLLIPIWIMLGLKILCEVCSLLGDWRTYFKQSWNYFDMGLNIFTYFGTIAVDSYSSDARTVKWLVSVRLVNMVLIVWRSVTWLRVFKPTRYLVTMILAVFAKMVYFLIILMIFILTYAFMWRVTLSLTEEQSESEMSFYSSLLYSMDIIFGNSANLTNDGQNVSVIQAIVHSLGNVLIALALLNFLIAIISGVYEEVNEDNTQLAIY